MELCEQRGVPLVFVVHNEDGGQGGIDLDASDFGAANMSERQLFRRAAEAKDVGKLIAAVSAATVPKITLVAGDLQGVAAHALCGRASSPDFVFAWPTARIGMATGRGGETTVGGPWADIEAAKAKDSSTTSQSPSVEAETPMRDAFYAASRLWIDSVIPFEQTRETLGLALRLCKRKGATACGEVEWQKSLPPLRL